MHDGLGWSRLTARGSRRLAVKRRPRVPVRTLPRIGPIDDHSPLDRARETGPDFRFESSASARSFAIALISITVGFRVQLRRPVFSFFDNTAVAFLLSIIRSRYRNLFTRECNVFVSRATVGRWKAETGAEETQINGPRRSRFEILRERVGSAGVSEAVSVT